jgi:putative transposase
MARKIYPSDLSERQWHVLKPLIPAPKASGSPGTVDISEIVKAMLYVLSRGCAWRWLAQD